MKLEKILYETKDNNLNDFYPIFKKNGVIIDKKENEYWLIPHKERPVTVNNTTYEILCSCNGKNSMNQITDTISSKYDVYNETVKKDLIRTLYSLSSVNLIAWKKGTDYFGPLYQYKDKTINCLYKRLEYINVRKGIDATIDKAILTCKYKKDNMYTNLNLQVRMAMGKEVYFACYDEDVLLFLIALEPIISIRPVLEFISYHLEYLYVDNFKPDTVYKFKRFLEWCISWYLESNNLLLDLSKIVISTQLLEEDIEHAKQLRLLEFMEVGKLCHENKTNDVRVFEIQIIIK
jgi:hypothetical protein